MQAEEKYRNIFEHCMEGIFQTAPEGRFISANTTAARLLGYDSPEDLINSVTDIGTQVYAYPEDRDKAMELLRMHGSFENFEMKCRKKDGSIVWGSLTSRLVRDEQGNVLYIEGTSQDITDRKMAEENLKLHDEILKNMAEGACLVRTDERVIVYANPRFEQMFGYGPGELIGKHISALNAPNMSDPKKTASKIIEHLNATGTWSGDIQNIKKDGTPFWCHVNASTFAHPKYGNVWIGVHEDITDRMLAEELIRKSEEKFKAIANYTYDWESWIGPNGKPLWINPGVSRITGYSPEECMAMDNYPIPLVYQPDRGRTEKFFHEALHGSTGNDIEFRVLCKDGCTRWAAVSWQPIYSETGASLGHRSSIHDITERKQIEEALRENEEKYRSLVEHAYDAILIADIEGNLIEANKKAEDLLGYTREELIGINISYLHPAEEHGKIVHTFKEMVEGKLDRLLDTKVLRKDGKTTPIDISGGTVGYGGKQVALGIFRDITERKRMEEYLKEYHERLEKLVEERTKELRMKSMNLEEVNIALKVLLEQREKDKTELQDNILFNVKKLVLPYLDSLKQRSLNDEQKTYLDVLETNLRNIISPFAKKLTSIHEYFTPQELKIADLIREGKTVKEIALAFGVSESTINSHRQHIRDKLGLSNQKVNLRTYLLSLA